MSTREDWVRVKVPKTGADTVVYCTCGCPVVDAEGAMEAHIERIHKSLSAAPAIAGVARWERLWV